MTTRPHHLAWAPPLLVGASAAMAAETSVALLLYAGPGFLRSLTAILAVGGVALAAGLWSAPTAGSGAVERLRRRWLLCLLAFLAAAVFGTAWSVPDLLGGGRYGQALGLAFLAAAPLYTSGAVLGGIASIAPQRVGAAGTAAAAVLGAGLGFVATGLLLPRTPVPGTLLLACLVMLSLGGMVFGSVLESSAVEIREERETPSGVVRVVEHRLGPGPRTERVLLQGEHERARVQAGGEGPDPWDVAVARALSPGVAGPFRVLSVGGGASSLARTVLGEHAGASVLVLDRSVEVVELGRRHLDTGLAVGDGERVHVRVGHLEDLIKAVSGRFDVVVVDTVALAAVGGLSRESRGRLAQAVARGGVLAWGPTPRADALPELAADWPLVTLERVSAAGAEEVLLFIERHGPGELPDPVAGFAVRNGGAGL